MAADILLLAGLPPVSPGPEYPPPDAAPAVHLHWCERFARYCTRQARIACDLDLPTGKWLRAAELAAFAASIWRERAEGSV